MSKHILILSASVGAGHIRAAEAVGLAVSKLDGKVHSTNIDVLQMGTRVFRKIYAKAYMDMVNRAPHMVGYFYDLFDRENAVTQSPFILGFEKLSLLPFVKMLKSQHWDVIVSTHYLPASIVAELKKKKELSVPQMIVTTDFDTHRFWVNEPSEHYFTATKEGAVYLNHLGIPEENISVTGIPIHPVFGIKKNKTECLNNFGLDGKKPVVLQISGGFGTGPVKNILTSLLKIKIPSDIIVVAGKNADLKKELDRLCEKENLKENKIHGLKIIGFTDKIDELFTIADIVLTKPGGLTTSEALSKGAALAVVNPTPGQEDRNSDYILENCAGIKINSLSTLAFKIEELLKNPKRLERIKRNSAGLGHPDAAFKIASKILWK